MPNTRTSGTHGTTTETGTTCATEPVRPARRSRSIIPSSGLAVALCLASACAGLVPAGPSGPSQVKEGVVRTTLPNGLGVVLIEDHSAPVVALNVWVRVGSADERPDEAGMAHVFEHMLFKGTERRAVGEIARTVEAAGGNINAYTSFDQTVYHITMASKDVATGIDVLADAVQNSTFDPEELAKESEVVVEEIKRGEDSAGRQLSQALFSTAYEAHPYRLPVIGSEESVRSFTREQLFAFLNRWYVPNNMTFVVVGDFEREAVLGQIRDAFKAATPNPELSHARTPEPEPARAKAAIVRKPFNQTLIGVSFPITGFAEADTPYVDLLAGVLGGGESSRLYRELKERRELVLSIGSSSYTPLDPGLFLIDAEIAEENLGQIEEIVRLIGEEVSRVRSGGISAVELDRAKINLLSGEVREKETMEGQARKYGFWEVIAGGIENEAEYLDKIRSATPEDLVRVANKYLRSDRSSTAVLLRPGVREDLDEQRLVAAVAASDDTTEIAAGEVLDEGIVRYELPNGLRLLVKRNPAVPLVSMRLAFLGGLLAETEATQGITGFLAEMLERGTEQRSATELAAEVESIAGSLSGFSGRNSFGVTAEFMRESLDTGLDLFADVVLQPSFEPGEIDTLRAETLAALKRREDSPSTEAFDLFFEAAHRGHPYRFKTLGTDESVKAFDQPALKAYYETYAHPRNGVLSVVGDVEPDEIARKIASYFAEWESPGEIALPTRSIAPAPDERMERSVVRNKNQVHIIVGFPGVAVADADGPALDVLTQVLSGQAGRLFLELRDKRSLAYSTAAFTMEGLDPGTWGVYIASAPDKLDESMSGLETELRRLLDAPIAPDELERARNYLIGTQAVQMQRFSNQATLLALDELYGLGATHHLRYGERIAAVTLDDVKRVAKRIIQIDAPIVAIVK